MSDWLSGFSASDFMPQIHGYSGRPHLVWTMFVTDLLIGTAYVAIALTLWALIRKIRIPFSMVVLYFGLFIGACGATHFMEVWTLWYPDYWLAAGIKIVTAIVSVGTGLYLIRLRRPIIQLAQAVKLAEQRRIDLEALNRDLDNRGMVTTGRLLEGQLEFKTFFECSSAGMAQLDAKTGKFSHANAMFSRITGYSEQELFDLRILDITHEDDRDGDSARYSAIASGEIPSFDSEKRFLRKGGGTVWVRLSVAGIPDESGNIIRTSTVAVDISEQKRAQAELERISVILSAVTTTSSDIIYAKDRQSRMVYCNPSAINLMGKSESEILGKNDLEFLGPGKGGEKILETDARIVASGCGEIAEEVVQWSDGRTLSYLSKKEPWRDSQGQIIGLIGISRDITDRKRAFDDLRVSEEKYKSLFSNMTEEVHYWQLVRSESGEIKTWRLIDANPAALKTWNKSLPDIQGKSADEIFGSGTTEHYMPIVRKVFDEGRPHHYENYFPLLDRHFRFSTFAVGDSFFTTGADITEIKKAEIALKESEAQFRQLSNSMTQLAWKAEADGSIYWYNDRWYEYTGTTLEDMKGWGWAKVHHPDYREKVVNFAKEAWKKPEPFELTFPLRSKNGEYRWFLTRAVPVLNEKGQIYLWFGTNTDITEQLKAQEDLKQALNARDEFLSIASHELKTPLTTLKLRAQLANRNRARGDLSIYSPEKVNLLIEQTDRQVERLDRLVDDMLDITRIRAGKLAIQKEPVLLDQLAAEILERMASSFKDAGVSVTFECPEPIEGNLDRLRVEQAVTNLLTNALRYGQRKPVRVRLERAANDPNYVRFVVQDQGIGIAPEAQERIFDRFERAVSPSEVSGLGLGLFITQQVIEAQGGKVWVESEGLGCGSTFYFELPLKQVDQS